MPIPPAINTAGLLESFQIKSPSGFVIVTSDPNDSFERIDLNGESLIRVVICISLDSGAEAIVNQCVFCLVSLWVSPRVNDTYWPAIHLKSFDGSEKK